MPEGWISDNAQPSMLRSNLTWPSQPVRFRRRHQRSGRALQSRCKLFKGCLNIHQKSVRHPRRGEGVWQGWWCSGSGREARRWWQHPAPRIGPAALGVSLRLVQRRLQGTEAAGLQGKPTRCWRRSAAATRRVWSGQRQQLVPANTALSRASCCRSRRGRRWMESRGGTYAKLARARLYGIEYAC